MNPRNPVILCVDDEAANLRLLEKLLVPRGYVVVSAASGKDALRKIKSQAIDLVLLDIIMPGMDGFEVCRQIKEDQKLRDIPIIMITVLTSKQDRIRGIEVGAEEFLSKPFDQGEVLARIKILLKVKELSDKRQYAEVALQKSHNELESKVQERTAELTQANAMLQADIIERMQIEETLQKSEENFRRSLEDSPLGERIATAKGETIYANKVILDIYGYANVEELNKIPLKERYTPQSYAEFHLRKKDRDRGDFGPSEYEINIVRKNGEIRHLLVLRKEVLWNGTRQFQVIYQDITERKWAEAALRESEERFRVLFESSRDAIMILEPPDWNFSTGNQTTVALFRAKNLQEFIYFGPGKLSPERQPDGRASIEKAREMIETAMREGSHFFEWTHIRTDGEEFSATVLLTRTEYAGKTILQATVRDITKQKKAQLMLRESEERYRAIIDTSRDCVFITSVAGRWLYMNDAAVELFDYSSREELSQVNISYLYVNPEERAKVISNITEHGYSKEFPVDLLRKDSSIINALITAVPRYGADGNVTGFQGTIRDITERKQVEEKIKNSLAEKELLLKEVHHRVKNNLLTIIGLIKMQETKADNERFNPLLQELEGRIRAMALVHESLYKSADLAHVDLQNYIETMSAQIRAQFSAERDIRFSVQGARVDVNLDIAVPCGLILNELITNAYKHAFPGNRPRSGKKKNEVTVTAKEKGGVCILTVADNGVGLPADLDWEKSNTLGLQLVRMLSHQINGSLEMERSSGTVFRLKFPVAVI